MGGAEWGGRSRGDGLCSCSTGPVDTARLWSVLLCCPTPCPSPYSMDPVTGGPAQKKKASESMTLEEQEVEARKLEDAIARLNRWGLSPW